jgi:hypothetical protein
MPAPRSRPSGPRPIMAALGLALVTVLGCTKHVERRHHTDVRAVDSRSPYIKAHMRDGSVYVLARWTVDPSGARLTGDGELVSVDRQSSRRGWFNVTVAEVALFETNVVHASPSITALAIITGVSAGLTLTCLLNTKACFGSCPTFYAWDGEQPLLQAEGFSDSVAPSLEARDVDSLSRTQITGRDLQLRMTNEALETHVVKAADLLAAPRPATVGGRVFAAADGRFWQASASTAPASCAAAEGDCLDAVRTMDGAERFSAASDRDLAAREVIDLTFVAEGARPGRRAIVVAARQTLLSTYVLYQGLAYMGQWAGTWLAALENGDARLQVNRESVLHVLGGIEVLTMDARGQWVVVGEVKETGPLAADVHLVALPDGLPADRVRLRLTRGHWRLDQVARVTLGRAVTPIRLAPSVKQTRQSRQFAPERPPGSAFPLVTLPGDEYLLSYRLPERPEGYELFLESRGYYLEWMRREWQVDEDPWRAMQLVVAPGEALRRMAPQFKRQEASMEQAFWRSRYAQP